MRGVAPSIEPDVEHFDAPDLLAWASERFGVIAHACSFQKEASVLLHMLATTSPSVRFFTLDTGVLFPETIETWRALEARYGITIEGLVGERPERLWETDPDRCCDLRKVVPMRDRLQDVDAWVAGLRRDQSSERAGTPKLQWDARYGLWKLNPLADWTDRDVWRYLHEHDIPYNPLHDRGYASIGCEPCTRPGDGREGRWAGLAKNDCGLHA